MVAAILQELALRKAYVKGETLDTIYFGGGTPSLLSQADLVLIFEKINQLLANKSLRSELSKKALEQAAKFSWEKTAQETLAVFEELLQGDK